MKSKLVVTDIKATVHVRVCKGGGVTLCAHRCVVALLRTSKYGHKREAKACNSNSLQLKHADQHSMQRLDVCNKDPASAHLQGTYIVATAMPDAIKMAPRTWSPMWIQNQISLLAALERRAAAQRFWAIMAPTGG